LSTVRVYQEKNVYNFIKLIFYIIRDKFKKFFYFNIY
jgi:hypothetical protein